MDQDTINWLRFLNPAVMQRYTDAEIWSAWTDGGVAPMFLETKTRDLHEQAELLIKVEAGIHKAIATARTKAHAQAELARHAQAAEASAQAEQARRAQVIICTNTSHAFVHGEAKLPEPKRHRFDDWRGNSRAKLVFCSDCGFANNSWRIPRVCTPADVATKNFNIEEGIAAAMHAQRRGDFGPREKNARIRMKRMDKVEATGKPWAPKGTTLFHVAPRRYAFAVGQWNKRAVK